ncbi:MAG: hypothetical protein H6622_06475 [Halobacteriovoraceae bacterium]|nr:hypothetical protein [Halobacteriovoraceae bacterium]
MLNSIRKGTNFSGMEKINLDIMFMMANLHLKNIILLILLAINSSLCSEFYQIELEWEPVNEAFSYEVEVVKIFKGTKNLVDVYKSVNSRWSDRFPVGSYQFKIRSLDYRGVPGPWSDYVPFDVNFPSPMVIRPVSEERVKSSFEDSELVTFQWNPVDGAAFYYIEVFDDKDLSIHQDFVKGSKVKINLPTQKNYKWRLTPLASKDDKIPPVIEYYKFYLEGLPLQAPDVIVRYENTKLRVFWKKIPDAQFYSVKVYRQDKLRWPLINQNSPVEGTNIYFPAKSLKKAIYRVAVQTHAKGRLDSETSFVEFEWDGGGVKLIEKYRPLEESRMAKLEEDYMTKLSRRGPLSAFVSLELPRFTYQGTENYYESKISRNLSAQRFTFGLNYRLGLSSYSIGTYSELTTYLIDDLVSRNFHMQAHLYRDWKKNDWLYFAMLGGFIRKALYLEVDNNNTSDNSDDTVYIRSHVTVGPTFTLGVRYTLTNRLFLIGKYDDFIHMSALTTPDQTKHVTSNGFALTSWLSYNYDAAAQFRVGYSLLYHQSSLTQLKNASGQVPNNTSSNGDISGQVFRLGFALHF